MQNASWTKAHWLFDSGCGKHMTGDKANLVDYKVCTTGRDIRFSGGELNPSLGFGNVKVGSITITVVLHVKGLKYNHLSMNQIADKGFSVKIKSNSANLLTMSQSRQS